MRAVMFVFLFLLFPLLVNARTYYEGYVIDSITGKGIPYVNIGVKMVSKGTVSNDQGHFRLEMGDPDEVISFSSIGYESVDVMGTDLIKRNRVKLIKKVYLVEEIQIEAKRYSEKEVVLGVKNDKRGHSVGFGNPQLGTEIGTLIHIDRPTFIKTANFVLNHAKGDSLHLRVNIYDYENGEIGEKVIKENVYIIDQQKKGTITIDLTAYDLTLENDVMLALEWLRNFDEIGNKGVTFDTKKSKKLKGVYLKHFSNGIFRQMQHKPKIKPCFYFTGKQEK